MRLNHPEPLATVLVTRTSSLSVSLEIVAERDDFGLRWQSEAATPLWNVRQARLKRRGASLPAALQNVWLRLRRAALYRGFPIHTRRELRTSPVLPTSCRLEVGDTAGWKPALQCKRQAALLAIFTFLAAFVPAALAHEGHDKAPGEGGEAPTSGPIAITAEAKKNLALQVEEAQLRALEKTVLVIGQIEAIPNRSAAVSSRVPGRVTSLKVTDGQMVKAGETVVEVESRQLGDPPPRVSLAAPMDGLVMDRHVVIGDSVEPNQHLLEIGDLSEVYAEGHLFEGQVAAVKPGQKVRIYVESYPKDIFSGTVDLVSGSLDPQTRTLKVWARVQNPGLKLRPKMRAQLNVVVAEADTAVTVPHSAVLGEAGNFFIFVQSDTDELAFERNPVVLGLKDDRYFEVIEGVLPSDKVVTLGNYQLQYVTTRKPAAKPAEAGGTNAPAATHHDETPASHEHASTATSPLLWMGVTVAALLLLNALILLMKRRAPKSPEATKPTPALANAQEIQ